MTGVQTCALPILITCFGGAVCNIFSIRFRFEEPFHHARNHLSMQKVLNSTKKGPAIASDVKLVPKRFYIESYTAIQHVLHQFEEPFHHAKGTLSVHILRRTVTVD